MTKSNRGVKSLVLPIHQTRKLTCIFLNIHSQIYNISLENTHDSGKMSCSAVFRLQIPFQPYCFGGLIVYLWPL